MYKNEEKGRECFLSCRNINILRDRTVAKRETGISEPVSTECSLQIATSSRPAHGCEVLTASHAKLPQSAHPMNLGKPSRGSIQELGISQDAYSVLAVAFFIVVVLQVILTIAKKNSFLCKRNNAKG